MDEINLPVQQPAAMSEQPEPLYLRVPVTPICPGCRADAPAGVPHECTAEPAPAGASS